MIKGLILLSQDDFNRSYGPEEQADLADRVTFVSPPVNFDTALARASLFREAEVIFSGNGMGSLDRLTPGQAPRLRAVFHAGESARGVADRACWSRRLRLSSPAAIDNAAIADYAVGAILIGLKHGFRHALHAHRHGYHAKERLAPGTFESTVGLVTLGAAGQATLRRLRSFDLRLIAHDASVAGGMAAEFGVEFVSLEEIFTRSDAVAMTSTIGAGSIQGRHFAAMKRGATLIAIGREAWTAEMDMMAELGRRPDLTAVLDVGDLNQPAAGSPLYTMPNVILTPRVAGALGREPGGIGRCLIEDFDRWQRSEPLRWEVHRDNAAHMA